MSLLSEFKEFAMKGNVVDMAVGIVIGAAFGKIVSSFVDALVMPALGWMIGGVDFSSLAVTLGTSAAGEPVTIGYGKFIQALVDFLIIAAAIFMALKAINRLRKPAPAAAPPPPPADVVLLTEIRDLLRRGQTP
ncbi:MAG TPA: large-conductance mechanosensitive channel protein MscL [Steroidobacteraceae bacterium]|nr:large-conductance mechanosensitive channel protein MscL [Steroidobacteraceae bacterium]